MVRILLFVWIAVACLSACGDDYAAKGREAFEKGQFRDAADFLQIALSASPSTDTQFYLGAAYAKDRRPKHACDTLRSLLDHPDWRRRTIPLYVRALLELDQVDEAQELVNEALRSEGAVGEVLEASVEVRVRRYQDAQRAQTELLEARLGADEAVRAGTHVAAMINAPAETYDAVFAEQMAILKDRLGFTDDHRLRNAVDDTRKSLESLQGILSQAAEKDPRSFLSRYQLADIAMERRDIDGVLNPCREILAMSADASVLPEERSALARTRLLAARLVQKAASVSGRFLDGLEVLEPAIRSFRPGTIDEPLCRLYYESTQPDKLEGVARAWLSREPRNVWAAYYLGWCYFQQEKYPEALPYFQQCHGASPNTGAFNLMLGRAYDRTGDLESAQVYLRRAVELSPHDAQAVLDAADVSTRRGQENLGRQLLLQALNQRFRNRHSPEHKVILDTLVRMYERAGQGITSLDHARKLYEEDGENPYVALRLSQLESEAGNFDRAYNLVREVQVRLPTVPDAWRVGAQIALHHKKAYLVHEQLRRLEGVSSGDPLIPWMRANVFLLEKKYDLARQQALLAIEASPGEVGTRLVLIDVETALGHPEEAVRLAEAATAVFPDSVELRERLAANLLAQERFKEAQTTLEWLTKRDPSSGAAHTRLGQCLLSLGRRPEAAQTFSKALVLASRAKYDERFQICLGLYNSKAFAEAEQAFLALLPDIPKDSSLYAQSWAMVALSRHWNRDYLGTTDAMVAMRRGDLNDKAVELMMELAAHSKSWDEILSIYDVCDQKDALPPRSLSAALDASLQVGDWARAETILARLEPRGTQVPQDPQRAVQKARLLMGLGQRGPALRILDEVIKKGRSPAQEAAWVLRARQAAERQEHAEVAKVVTEGLVDAPESADLRVLGAEASIALGRLDDAVLMLEACLARDRFHDRAQVLLCAAHVARESYRAAADAIARPRSRAAGRMAGLARTLVAGEALDSGQTLARFLGLLRTEAWKEAEHLATRVEDLPKTMAAVLQTLAQNVAGRPERANRLATLFARSEILREAGVLTTRMDAELSRVARDSPEAARFIEGVRAWFRLGPGSSLTTAEILGPVLATGEADTWTLYLAGLTALRQAGAGNVALIVNGQLGRGATVDPTLARDLARALADAGETEAALALLQRVEKPGDDDLALACRLHGARREWARVVELAGDLGPEGMKDQEVGFLVTYAQARTGLPGAKEALAQRLTAPAFNPDALTPRFLVEAYLAAQLTESLPDVLEQLVTKHPYDAYVLHGLAEALREQGSLPSWSERLALAASVVDPRARLRTTPTEERRRAPY